MKELDGLKSRIQRAQAVSAHLLIETAAELGIQDGTRGSERIDQLIRSAAWTEAALAVVEMTLPRWKPRRLACEGGHWYCALSRHWNAPDWLDNSIEVDHALLPLAILSAAIEARQDQTSRPLAILTVPEWPVRYGQRAEIVSCDNFA